VERKERGGLENGSEGQGLSRLTPGAFTDQRDWKGFDASKNREKEVNVE